MMADQSFTSAVFTPRSVVPTTLMFGIVLHDAVDHRLERRRVELALLDVDAFDLVAEHLLEILFVADQAVDVRHERLGRFDRFFDDQSFERKLRS